MNMQLCLIFGFTLVSVVFGQPIDDAAQRKAMENPDLFGGDMAGIDGPFDVERNAIPGENYRWPGAVVPYVIDSSVAFYTSVILKGMQDYHDNTCVRFVPRTDQQDYIRIFYGQGCYSHVGKTGGGQPVSLGDGCMFPGTVVHELGHALGFYHEQNRSDRDDYITVYLENVQSGLEYNFAKLAPSQNLLLSPFDYQSVMIYGNTAFSKDGKSYTMEAKDGTPLTNPYSKSGMASSDIVRVKKMYNC